MPLPTLGRNDRDTHTLVGGALTPLEIEPLAYADDGELAKARPQKLGPNKDSIQWLNDKMDLRVDQLQQHTDAMVQAIGMKFTTDISQLQDDVKSGFANLSGEMEKLAAQITTLDLRVTDENSLLRQRIDTELLTVGDRLKVA